MYVTQNNNYTTFEVSELFFVFVNNSDVSNIWFSQLIDN